MTEIPEHLEHTYATIQREKWPPFLSPVRVARLLDLDRRRVYELIATGDLEAIRTGKRGLRINRDSLVAWLQRGGSGPVDQ